MALPPGTRFGVYEITSLIGSGGMGEVYRARDARLGRDVALKVLPSAVAADHERLARFRREAQILAALNHPNIAHVYGLDESGPGGQLALAMELVEGETLAQRIAREPIEIAEAFSIAKQIAAGLEAAHEVGIVHRDLKPANISIREDGMVKVLDFGIAKQEPGSAGSTGAADSPTITTPAMTEAGLILGTAAYMSPEQAKGRGVDKRSDVWAFGCVLYEMLTRAKAFDGESVSDTFAAILRGEPDWSRLPKNLPENVDRLVRGCLEKDRKARVPDIGVVRYLLENRGPAPTPVAAQRSRGAGIAVLIALAAFVAGGLATFAVIRSRSIDAVPAASRTTRFMVVHETQQGLTAAGGALAISPDGSTFVYYSADGFFVRRLDDLTPRKLEGTIGARSPFFSPDGQSIAFFTGQTLKKVSIAGGSPQTICTFAGGARGGAWSEDGTIVFAGTLSRGLQRVSAGGGEPKPLTATAGTPYGVHGFPTFLPGGRSVLFTAIQSGPASAPSAAAIVDLDSQAVSVVQKTSGAPVVYVPSGHLISELDGELRATPFDLDRRAVLGEPVGLGIKVKRTLAYGTSFAVSGTGTLIYEPADADSKASRELVWVDRSGKEESVGAPNNYYEVARLSPDGTRIAADIRDGDYDIWIWDVAKRKLGPLTFDPAEEQVPFWSRDGQFVYYTSNVLGLPSTFRMAANGAGKPERLTEFESAHFATSIAPEDSALVLFRQDTLGYGLVMMPIKGTTFPVKDSRVLTTPDRASQFDGEISPDGKWLAYHSNESGRNEVWVRPFPDVESGKWLISSAGGSRAAWARNGRELFYLNADGRLMGAQITVNGKAISSGAPVTILSRSYVSGTSARGLDLRSYDVSVDGQRFLMVKENAVRTSDSTPIVVVTSWLTEVSQRAPRTP